MGDQAGNPHPSAIEYIPDRIRTQEICDKAVNRCVFLYLVFSIKLKKCVT